MKKILCLICLLLLPSFAHALPPVITGTIGKAGDAKVAAALGRYGVLFIRTEARWKEFQDRLGAAVPINAEVPKTDFAKQNVVLVYDTDRRPDDTLSLVTFDPKAAPPELKVMLFWDNNLMKHREAASAQFFLAVIPASPMVKVILLSAPQVKGIALPVMEFSAILGGKDGGDIVDGLQATITPKAATIKPGDDILIDFDLHLADPGKAKPEQFGTMPKSIFVWDSISSGGYRNHAFFVTTPDGKTTLLRPKEHGFRRNIPHPEEITADKPYHLPSSTAQSLKELGLDTSASGTYTITGLYEETGSVEDKKPMWGGSITSDTITVEVKK